MRFAKGHGTENDFVILPDPDGVLDLSPRLVARLCDRRTGLGGDGVLRVVRAAAMMPQEAGASAEANLAAGTDAPAAVAIRAAPAAPTAADAVTRAGVLAGADLREDALWFMDYRNADGSVAEMCGNGIRVFARYLLEAGLADGDELTIATRSGPRRVLVRPDGRISVDMGVPMVLGPGHGVVGGQVCQGLRISVGNPHLACIVDTSGTSLDEFDLSSPPELDPGDFPEGANVELVEVTGRAAVRMRVRERGSGETRSCGTGAVAAAVAAAHAAQRSQAAQHSQAAQRSQAASAARRRSAVARPHERTGAHWLRRTRLGWTASPPRPPWTMGTTCTSRVQRGGTVRRAGWPADHGGWMSPAVSSP